MFSTKKIFILCVSVAFIACKGCILAGRAASTKPIINDTTLLGNFTDDYNIKYTITANSFTQHPGVKYNLLLYNEKEQYFIAQNDSTNVSDGGLFTRIDIMRFKNMTPWQWGFCLTTYNAPNKEAAINAVAADRINPKKGCGGYPFSRMKRVD